MSKCKLPVEEYQAIANHPELENATLFSVPIRDLKCFAGCPKLRRLYIKDCREVESLDGLEDLASLTSLTMSSVKVSDLSPLAACKNLTSVDLGGPNLEDITPLKKLTNLNSISISNSPKITEKQIEELKEALPNCSISFRKAK